MSRKKNKNHKHDKTHTPHEKEIEVVILDEGEEITDEKEKAITLSEARDKKYKGHKEPYVNHVRNRKKG